MLIRRSRTDLEKREFNIIAETGILARPDTLLVTAEWQLHTDIHLEYKGKSVNLKSNLGVMSLGVGTGADVNISAEGADEADDIADITDNMKKEGLAE